MRKGIVILIISSVMMLSTSFVYSQTTKSAGQAAPVPHDTAQASAEDAGAAPGARAEADTPETAEAAMVEPVPLTRRQRRLLRKQQEQGQEFLPWLR